MCDLSDLLLGDCTENPGGIGSTAYVIGKNSLTTFASTFADAATQFSDQVAYATTGPDYVVYDGDVYACSTTHAAGAWNGAHFTLVPNGNVRVKGAHVPAATKSFAVLELNDEEGDLTFETLGKKFSRTGKLSVRLYHPGSSVEAAEFSHKAKLAGGIVALIPMPNGTVVQLGTKNSLAELVGSFQSGTRENPDSRWMFEISCYARSLVYYESALPV